MHGFATDISQTFQVLSYCPPLPLQEASLRVIEQFVMNTHDSAVEAAAIDLARYDIFKYKGDLDIRSLPPTRDALVLHTHRAAFFFIFTFFMHFCPGTMTTDAESINSDLQRGLDRRSRHTQHLTQNRTS